MLSQLLVPYRYFVSLVQVFHIIIHPMNWSIYVVTMKNLNSIFLSFLKGLLL